MKFAVIGSGMAAAGAIEALARTAPQAEITLFEEPAGAPHGADVADAPGSPEFYRSLRRAHGAAFPPPKTHFGEQAERRPVEGWSGIWRARGRGGLTRYWGGSALPFTDRDLRDWPIGLDDLAPYYAMAAESIGVSGRKDALSAVFRAERLTRPPLKLSPTFWALDAAVGSAPPDPDFRFTSGVSRLALDTRPESDSRCRYSGDCMIGCGFGAIYDARTAIDRLGPASVVGEVLSVSRERRVQVRTATGSEWSSPFDKVYICAGAPQTTAIVMRSLGLDEGPLLTDNAVFTFPIFSSASAGKPEDGGYFGLTNLLVECEPTAADQPAALVQVYPAFDHLWRYFTPSPLWPVAGPMGRALRERMMIARIYLDGSLSQRYGVRIEDGEPHWRLERPPAERAAWTPLWTALRRTLNRRGFHVPAVGPMGHKTSSHYAASLPMGGGLVDKQGAVADGVYVCDSAAFAGSPANSPSFTIFAFASRVATESL